MRQLHFILVATCCSLALASPAQDLTNAPKTEIENFEAQTGKVIIKGFGQTGSVTVDAGVISVRCKETADVATGIKEYGIAIKFDGNNRQEAFAIVDYDELDALLNGMNYLGKITYDVTPMPSFDAAFTTKSGLRIAAHSERRQGGIHTFLRFADAPRILLTSDQLAQFQNLIGQAKATLDSLKNK